jgi:GT2 family glycosyltransferase
MSTAVVTLVSGRRAHLANQHRALLRSARAPDHYVVVAIDDPEVEEWLPDGPLRPLVLSVSGDADGLPLASARNLGARSAIDLGADVLVFLDVDCLPSIALVAAYTAAARRQQTRSHVLCGPVAYLPPPPQGGYDLAALDDLADPHPARPAPAPGEVLVDHDGHHLFWSLSFALRTEVWTRLGGFDEAYVGYGAEDTDFGQRVAAAGLPLTWVGGACAYHQYHPVSDPPIEHVEDIVRNANRFRGRWGFWPMAGWLDAFATRGLVELDGAGRYVMRASGPRSSGAGLAHAARPGSDHRPRLAARANPVVECDQPVASLKTNAER